MVNGQWGITRWINTKSKTRPSRAALTAGDGRAGIFEKKIARDAGRAKAVFSNQ